MCQTNRLLSLVHLFWLLSHLLPSSTAMCPRGCRCDDITLEVTCSPTAALDFVPNTLNPGLQRLLLADNQIKAIKSSLSVYSNLKLVDFSRNRIASLEDNSFMANHLLDTLVLSRNVIATMHNDSFKGLVNLKRLQLNDNQLDELGSNVFRFLTNLELLDLSNNKIDSFDQNTFNGLKSLRRLILRHNNLTHIPAGAFSSLPSLKSLDFGLNLFSNLSKNAFVSTNSLDELCLDGCAIEYIEAETFKGLDSLSILRLQNNLLKKIPSEAFSDVTRLEVLQLGQNDFKTLSSQSFSQLQYLKSLEVNGAPFLETIEKDAFFGLYNLERLDVSWNQQLKIIEPNAFVGMQNIRYINLRGNAFSTLNDISKDLGSVLLDVRDNPFVCNCSLAWLKSHFYNVINISQTFENATFGEDSFSSLDLFIGEISQVICQSPPALKNKTVINLHPDEFGCFELDTKIPLLIAIIIGLLLVSGVIIIFVIRCKYMLTGLVKRRWFSDKKTNKSRNDLNFRKEPDFVFIPNLDLNIEENNRLTHAALEDAVRYPLKLTPITEL